MAVLRLPADLSMKSLREFVGQIFGDFFYKRKEGSKIPACRFLLGYCEKTMKKYQEDQEKSL